MYPLSLVLLFILALSSFYSPLRAVPNFNALWAAIVAMWSCLTLFDNWRRRIRATRFQWLVILYVAYTVGFAYATGNGAIGNRFFELSQIPLFYLAYEKNAVVGRERNSRRLVLWLTPFAVVTSILTLRAYGASSWASRIMIIGDEVRQESMKAGVGGYEFIYCLVITCAVLGSVVYSRRAPGTWWRHAIATSLLGVFSLNVALSGFSTALFLILGVLLLRVLQFPVKVRYALPLVLGVALLGFLASEMVVPFARILSGLLGSDSLNAARLDEMMQLYGGQGTGVATQARLNAFHESSAAFLSHPILGILATPLSWEGGFLMGFGQHSQILDTFALYGLGIGVLQLYIYGRPLVVRLQSADGYVSWLSVAVTVVFVMVATVDNVTPSIGFATYFLFPTAYNWLYEENASRHSKGLVLRAWVTSPRTFSVSSVVAPTKAGRPHIPSLEGRRTL